MLYLPSLAQGTNRGSKNIKWEQWYTKGQDKVVLSVQWDHRRQAAWNMHAVSCITSKNQSRYSSTFLGKQPPEVRSHLKIQFTSKNTNCRTESTSPVKTNGRYVQKTWHNVLSYTWIIQTYLQVFVDMFISCYLKPTLKGVVSVMKIASNPKTVRMIDSRKDRTTCNH